MKNSPVVPITLAVTVMLLTPAQISGMNIAIAGKYTKSQSSSLLNDWGNGIFSLSVLLYLPLNSRLGPLNEEVLSGIEIDPFKTKSNQDIDGSYNKFQANPGSGAWSDFEALGGVNRDNSDPTVIPNSDGRLQVLAADNQLYHKWQTAPGSSTWSAYQSLGGVLGDNSSPSVVRDSDGRLEVFVVLSNNQLHHKWAEQLT